MVPPLHTTATTTRAADDVEVTGTATGLGKVYHAPQVACTVTVRGCRCVGCCAHAGPLQSFGASFGQLPSFFPLQLSTSALGGACVSSDLTIPAARPTWTCGLQVTGAFDCSAVGTMVYTTTVYAVTYAGAPRKQQQHEQHGIGWGDCSGHVQWWYGGVCTTTG